MKIGITFASVQDEFEKDPLRALDEIVNAGYEAFEVARYDSISCADLSKALRQRGLKAVSGHFLIFDFEDGKYEETLECADAYGLDTLVIPWCPKECFENYDTTVKAAKTLDELAAKVKERGFKLIYHNHWDEFLKVFNGKYVEDILLENSSLLGFEFDIGWAHAAGCDAAAYISKLGKRLVRLHIKDIHPDDDRLPVEIGTGAVNIRACMDAAAAAGCEYGIVEQDSPAERKAYPSFESIWVSRKNLRGFGY